MIHFAINYFLVKNQTKKQKNPFLILDFGILIHNHRTFYQRLIEYDLLIMTTDVFIPS